MFNGAKNVVINGGSFVANVEPEKGPNLDRLFDKVALNAILNAGGRADEVRCYPGTRELVIGKVERWMDGQSEEDCRMLWLSGPAGAGKSAIVQTVAERCKERGTHAANFFFFRGDGTRNHAQPLVATLVYQLLDFYPALHEHLKECLARKPLAYKASTQEQFIQFISSPITTIQHSSSIHQPIILFVDGLDECDDEREQERIITSLHALVEDDRSPFRVLVASRAEPNLVMSFNKIQASVESIFLDGDYRPDDDVRRFVVGKFEEIKRVHSLSHTLSRDWPAKEDIDEITRKSSGQFIYAATVIRYIQHSSESPVLSLRTIRGMRPSVGNSPLAHLNAVYSHIFSKARDLKAVRFILGGDFMRRYSGGHKYSFKHLLNILGYEKMEVKSLFADLVAIIQVTTDPSIELVFYHASLADYLKDKSQSGIYHVGLGEIAEEMSLVCLKNFGDTFDLSHTLWAFSHVKEANTELSEALLEASARQIKRYAPTGPKILIFFDGPAGLFDQIELLYLKKDRALFKSLLKKWIRFALTNGIAIEGPFVPQRRTISRYFEWCLAIERTKYALTNAQGFTELYIHYPKYLHALPVGLLCFLVTAIFGKDLYSILFWWSWCVVVLIGMFIS